MTIHKFMKYMLFNILQSKPALLEVLFIEFVVNHNELKMNPNGDTD